MKLRKTLAGILGAVVMLLGVGTFEHINRDTGVHADETITKTVKIQDYAVLHSWKDSTKYTSLEMDDNITITVSGGSNTGKYYENGYNWRIYQNENPKITLTAYNDCTLSSVKFTYSVSKSGVLTFNKANKSSGTIISLSGSSAEFRVGNTGTKNNGQVRITNVEVKYFSPIESEPHTCVYDKMSILSSHLDTEATCTESAIYFYSCECGENGSEKFVYGNPLGHNFVNGECSRGNCDAIDAKYFVNELFKKYYNSGSYVKETVLNINEFAKEEVEDYLHAGAQIRYRKTTYAPGELTMVTKETEADAWGTHTSTYKDNANGGVDHYKNGVLDYSVSGTYKDQDRSSVENWYVTLFDFVNSTFTNWECTDGVYTLSLNGDATATKMAREFVAPMWLDNETTKNYVTYDKLTVEEVGNSLVMKVYITGDNSGLLINGANLVLAQATIERTIDTSAKDVTESLNLSFTDLVKDKSGDTYLEDNYPTWTINGTIGKTYGGYLGFGKSGDTSSSITSPEFVASKNFVVNVVLKGNGSNGVATSTMTFEVLDKNGDVITNSVTETPANSKDTTYSIKFTYNSEKSYADAAYIRLSFTKNTGNIGLKSLSVSYVD